jgi:CheY-like chemotaxis protein
LARKILLADDSVTAQNMGRKILTDAGYDVITVNNGSAALKRVAEHQPDLIVLDVYMPGYSGLEVCARLKDSQETARTPILLTVGKLEPFKPEEAQRVRADAYIVKPFEASELLSVLTRLEDRMVPQAEGTRFSTSVSGIERFTADPAVRKSENDGGGDSGWKSRLRFPSKKKKEEPEPEPEMDVATAPFRDFKKGASKAPAASSTFPVEPAPSAVQEPGLVSDIPRDITPEELDALSALVAKLDGPIPAAENIAPLSEKIGPVETPAAPAEVKHDAEVDRAAQEANSAEVPPAETRLPASHAIESVASTVEAAAAEAPQVEVAPPAAVPVAAETLASVLEPAPVDQDDEPLFAADANAKSPVAVEENHDVLETPAAASTEPSPAVEAAHAEPAAAAEEPKLADAPKAEESPQAAPAAAESKVITPSPEELVEALRLLTPSLAPGAPQTLAEAGAALVDELSRGAGAGSRWVAEAVALSPEEASASLEEEMLRKFAPRLGSGPAASGDAGSGRATVGHAEEEAAAAAVKAAEGGVDVSPAAMVTSAAAVEKTEPAYQDSRAKPAEEALEEEVASMTFADAVLHDQVESVAASSEAANSSVAGSPVHEEVASSEDSAGGRDAMSKDAKGKGGKSNWRQIHSAPAAMKGDVVEAAKQAEETPKAMAAAASADGGTADPNMIASIVDSILADLRPKIVEEIAKKLAKKD